MNFSTHRGVKVILLCFLVLSGSAWGQEIHFDVSSSVDWIEGQIKAQTSFEPAQAGLKLPSGRLMAEEILMEAYPRLLRPCLLSLKTDSNSTVGDLVERGELSLQDLNNLIMGAKKTAPSFSGDLSSMIGRYTVFMDTISSLLLQHRRAVESPRPLLPVQSPDYTGIIIIANEELNIRGRYSSALLEPCLFPKIWDTNMTLIYEKQMRDPARHESIVRYSSIESIFRPTPSGLEGELAAFLGPRPLRILAREAFGTSPTDPVIDREDALKIISSDNNRRLLREGRVLLVLNGEMFKP